MAFSWFQITLLLVVVVWVGKILRKEIGRKERRKGGKEESKEKKRKERKKEYLT